MKIKSTICQIAFFLLVVLISSCTKTTKHEITNSNLLYCVSDSVEQEAQELLEKMTLKEKVLQLASHYPNGNNRLGIPHMQAGECLHGVTAPEATSFPQAIAMGATWCPEIIERMGNIVAAEARALGIHHCYTPMLGLARDPRWGRADESYGEDPYLVGQIGAAYINGLQGRGEQRFDKNHILATAKHYVADGEPLAGDNGAAVEISKRYLHETHLIPFQAVIEEAGVGAIMPAHHALNGIPCHISPYLLNDVLRDEMGFDGLIVSDNNDIRRAFDYLNVGESIEEVIKTSLECNVTTELAWQTSWGDNRMYGPPLIKAIEDGKIDVSLVDKAVLKVLEYKIILGLFDDETAMNPANDLQNIVEGSGENVAYADTKHATVKARHDYKDVLYNKKTNALALEVAEKSIILLKNENNLLPLDKNKLKNIAVIGPNADVQVLGGYSTKQPRYFVTVLDGVKNIVSKSTKVSYAQGVDMHTNSTKGIDEAVKLAKRSDVVILVVGGDNVTMKENQDRDDITFAGKQEELIKAVQATGKPVVLVLIHGRALAIGWGKEHINAILDGWYLGQETGNAVAKTIFGENNPGGKLPVTYVRNAGQLPCYYNALPTGRERNIYGSSSELLYPFGYGISYTKFEFTDIKLSKVEMTADETIYASVTVKNTGEMKGDEVVQMYIRDERSSYVRPKLELKGFKRISLEPGESKVVELPISHKALQFWKEGKWIVEPGGFTVMIGTNSVDLESIKLEVKTNL